MNRRVGTQSTIDDVAARPVGRSRRHRRAGRSSVARRSSIGSMQVRSSSGSLRRSLLHRHRLHRRRCGRAGGTSTRSTRRATPGGRSSFTVDAERHARDASASGSGRRASSTNARVFRWYVEHNGGLELDARLLRSCARATTSATCMRVLRTPPVADLHQGHVPRGLHARSRWPSRLDREVAERMTPPTFMTAATDADRRVADSARPASTSLEGLLFPDTYQVSNGETPRPRSLERMVDADGARRRARRTSTPRRQPLGLHAVPDPDHRLDDRARGQDRRGPAEDRPGHLQPPRRSGMPLQIDATLLLRPGSGGLDASPQLQRRSTRRTTRTCTRACRRRRSPTPAGRRSRRRSTRRRTRASGDPLCQELPEPTDCQYLYYVLADEDGDHAFAVTPSSTRPTSHAARAAGLLGVIVGRHALAAVIGQPVRHSLSPALHNAAFARGRGRLGVRRLRGRARAAPAPRSTRCARSASAGCRSRCRTRRTSPRRSTSSTRRPPRCARSTPSCSSDDGRLVGHSTDGDGFVASLRGSRRRRRRAHVSRCSAPGPRRAAIVDALGRAGAARIVVVNRTGRARRGRGRAGRRGTGRSVSRRHRRGRHRRQRHVGRDGHRPSCRAIRRCCTPARSSPTSSTTRCETALLAAAASGRRARRRRARHARPPGRAASSSCGPATSARRRAVMRAGQPSGELASRRPASSLDRDASLPHRRRVARPGPGRDRRGSARRAGDHGRGDPGRDGPPPARATAAGRASGSSRTS